MVAGGQWKSVFNYVRDGTFNIASLILVVSIGFSYADQSRDRLSGKVSPLIASLVSLSSFIAVSGVGKEGFRFANFGVIGVFVAIVTAASSSAIFVRLCSLKALRIEALTDGADATFNFATAAIAPAALTILLFAAADQVLTVACGIPDIQTFISASLGSLFWRTRTSFGRGMLFIALTHALWFFGIHGANVLEPVAQSMFAPALAANQALIGLGQAPAEIFTKTFFDTFVLMGGCGATLCLACAIMIAGKRKNQRRLARMALVPMIFNINELVVFGIPIVLNPAYLVPFLCTPLIVASSSYLAMRSGLVPYTRNLVEWTTPLFLSGYVSTGSIRGCVLQLFNFGLGVLCYLPFVRLAEGIADERAGENLKKVYALVRQDEERGRPSALLDRADDLGSLARSLAADLEQDLRDGKVSLFYQPQVDYEGEVFGAEALLRWRRGDGEYVYPPLIIAIAEEAGLIDRLGRHIFDTACGDLRRMADAGFADLVLSVNISSIQLTNDRFIEGLKDIIRQHRVDPGSLEIEVTEQLAMASGRKNIEQTMAIKQLGIKLAMDDFGMGHSSLIYLKEYEFDTVKLDGSLVHEVLSNANCPEIITSIVSLGKSLNYSVIAEYVETDEQRRALHELGCDKYQGYLYSKALAFDEFQGFIEKRREKAGEPRQA